MIVVDPIDGTTGTRLTLLKFAPHQVYDWINKPSLKWNFQACGSC
jgi:hypothetical protein